MRTQARAMAPGDNANPSPAPNCAFMRPVVLASLALLTAGCAGTVYPRATSLSNALPTSVCGVGTVVVAPIDILLPDATSTSIDHKVPAGTRLVGIAVREYPLGWKGDRIWKLIGQRVDHKSKTKYEIGDVDWESGTISDFYHQLQPVPATMPTQTQGGATHLSSASGDSLFELSKDKDWVVRYDVVKELVARGHADGRLRAFLDQRENEPISLVRTTMMIGRYDLYPDVRPPFDRWRP